jgi:hypothetical protein
VAAIKRLQAITGQAITGARTRIGTPEFDGLVRRAGAMNRAPQRSRQSPKSQQSPITFVQDSRAGWTMAVLSQSETRRAVMRPRADWHSGRNDKAHTRKLITQLVRLAHGPDRSSRKPSPSRKCRTRPILAQTRSQAGYSRACVAHRILNRLGPLEPVGILRDANLTRRSLLQTLSQLSSKK